MIRGRRARIIRNRTAERVRDERRTRLVRMPIALDHDEQDNVETDVEDTEDEDDDR